MNCYNCTWHIDPCDKLAVIFYFGEFSEGEFCLGPPFNLKVPVRNFDTVVVPSASVFHCALPFKGTRFSISAYSKTTSEFTQKGQLIPEKNANWALFK